MKLLVKLYKKDKNLFQASPSPEQRLNDDNSIGNYHTNQGHYQDSIASLGSIYKGRNRNLGRPNTDLITSNLYATITTTDVKADHP